MSQILPRKQVQALLSRLGTQKARDREVAAAEIGDYLEAGAIGPGDYPFLVHELMEAALRETDPDARESLFNALSEASLSQKSGEIDWDPIWVALDELPADCLEHALVILGSARQPRYRAKVEKYLSYPDEGVRETAAAALAQMGDAPLKRARAAGD
jgi:Mg/Co/Ni transporter MgtE